MAHIFKNNKTPNIARTKRFFRPFIIIGIMLKTLFGGNPKNVDSAIRQGEWETDISKRYNYLKLKLKMVFYRYAYELNYNEFLGFKLENKSKKKCVSYISSYEKMRLYDEVVIPKPTYKNFYYKNLAYEMFKDFFIRDVIYIKSENEISLYTDFCNKHKKIVIKPVDHNGGVGVKVLDIHKDNLIAEFLDSIKSSSLLIEEYIEEDETLSRFHPQSVNTLRFTTFFDGKKLTKLYGMMRFGSGDSVVDNAGAGGYCACVDTKTGIIISNGFTHQGREYEFHPDTKIKFIGTQLPAWDEFSEILEKIVRVCPEQKYVGWDFAYGKNGWELIETNAGPGILAAQMCCGYGFREIFIKTLFKESKHFKQYASGKL